MNEQSTLSVYDQLAIRACKQHSSTRLLNRLRKIYGKRILVNISPDDFYYDSYIFEWLYGLTKSFKRQINILDLIADSSPERGALFGCYGGVEVSENLSYWLRFICRVASFIRNSKVKDIPVYRTPLWFKNRLARVDKA